MNASQLEAMFAEPGKRTPISPALGRSGLWSKYRRGEASPKVNDGASGKTSLVNRVEQRFSGTKRWFTMPLWDLLQRDLIQPAELKEIFLSLQPEVRNLIVHQNYHPQARFWRNQTLPEHLYESLVKIGSIDAVTAVLALIKEAEINQNQHQHKLGLVAWAKCAAKLVYEPVIGEMLSEINKCIEERFIAMAYHAGSGEGGIEHLGAARVRAIWKEHGPKPGARPPVTPVSVWDIAGGRL